MTLEQGYTIPEVAKTYRMSVGQINKYIREGRVGFLRGERGTKVLLPEHVAQVKAAAEVKPHADIPAHLDGLGLSARSIARRRAG